MKLDLNDNKMEERLIELENKLNEILDPIEYIQSEVITYEEGEEIDIEYLDKVKLACKEISDILTKYDLF